MVEVKENEEYCLHFKSAGRNITLSVQLDQSFPQQRPKLVISPLLHHPWINMLGEVEGAPGLLNVSLNFMDK